MNDSYHHEISGLIYTVECIPGPSENCKEYDELVSEFHSQITDYCDCTDICANDCSCLQRSGGRNYVIGAQGDNKICTLNSTSKDLTSAPILECNSLCTCSTNCGNRLVQKGPIENLCVKTCGMKGLGLFTTKNIQKGSFICEYAGEIITKTEALRRHADNSLEGKMNYIYCLKEHSNGKVVETFVDPSVIGNIGRYFNHSCDPNCVIIPVRVDIPLPKLAIFSCKDILPNTELTYDYGSCDLGTESSNYVIRKKCLCNSLNCKGWIPFEVY